jgi:Mg2+/Co2+ transporter CorB
MASTRSCLRSAKGRPPFLPLALAAASFFFALAETALFSLGKGRARQLAEQRPERGSMILRLLEQPSELLATISLGNTLANGSIVALALWPVLRGDWPALLAWGGALVLILVGCEVLPKTLAVRSPDRWALHIGSPVHRLMPRYSFRVQP